MNLSDMAAMLREEDKIRIYLVSMLGVIEAGAVPDNPSQKYAIYYHSPVIIEAQSINMAVDIAKHRVEELWPKAQGWKMRSVAVEPFEPASIKMMLQYWQTGMLATEINPPETGITVNLDGDSQSSILAEDDKPAS
jgi:hypothetical protein